MLKILMIGNLGKDAVVNQVNGKTVINFNLAHTDKFKNQQGTEINKTTWVQAAYWTDKTNVAQYLKKGTQVFIEGMPEIRSYDKTDGTREAVFTVRVLGVQLLGGNKQNTSSAPQSDQNTSANNSSNNITEASDITEPLSDLPF